MDDARHTHNHPTHNHRVRRRLGLWNDHICVASNCLRFPAGDDDAPATGFIPEDPIHVYNKSESSLGEVPLAGLLEGRRNVILAGDSEGDYGPSGGWGFGKRGVGGGGALAYSGVFVVVC